MNDRSTASMASIAAANKLAAEANGQSEHKKNLANPDFISSTFRRTAAEHAPLIKFDERVWPAKPDADKISYLHKLASSLNHAALKIQDERDELTKLLIHKEATIEALEKQLGIDRTMIHKQLARINEEKQKLNDENQGLYARITELEAKLKELGVELE